MLSQLKKQITSGTNHTQINGQDESAGCRNRENRLRLALLKPTRMSPEAPLRVIRKYRINQQGKMEMEEASNSTSEEVESSLCEEEEEVVASLSSDHISKRVII
jgi:hypothetical protein